MLSKLIKFMAAKSIGSDVVKMAVKSSQNDDVVKEKLGVSSIDEFMKMDIHEYQKKKGL